MTSSTDVRIPFYIGVNDNRPEIKTLALRAAIKSLDMVSCNDFGQSETMLHAIARRLRHRVGLVWNLKITGFRFTTPNNCPIAGGGGGVVVRSVIEK